MDQLSGRRKYHSEGEKGRRGRSHGREASHLGDTALNDYHGEQAVSMTEESKIKTLYP